jgi:hypothetical protein
MNNNIYLHDIDFWVPDENCDDPNLYNSWVESGHNIGCEELEATIINNIAESQKVIDFNTIYQTNFTKSEFQFIIDVSKSYQLLIPDTLEYIKLCHFCGDTFNCFKHYRLYCNRMCQDAFEKREIGCFRCCSNQSCLICKKQPSNEMDIDVTPHMDNESDKVILVNCEYYEEYLMKDDTQNGFINAATKIWHKGVWETDEEGRLIFYPDMKDHRNIIAFGPDTL